jgi:hypothetical protein
MNAAINLHAKITHMLSAMIAGIIRPLGSNPDPALAWRPAL